MSWAGILENNYVLKFDLSQILSQHITQIGDLSQTLVVRIFDTSGPGYSVDLLVCMFTVKTKYFLQVISMNRES